MLAAPLPLTWVELGSIAHTARAVQLDYVSLNKNSITIIHYYNGDCVLKRKLDQIFIDTLKIIQCLIIVNIVH